MASPLARQHAKHLPPGASDDVIGEYWLRHANEFGGSVSISDLRAARLELDAEARTQQLENEATLGAIEERRTRLRRRRGPSGFGATVFTTPLGVLGQAPGVMRMLGGGRS